MTATKLHPYWHGMLCAETRDDIAERMRAVLDGQYFTMVICNSYRADDDSFRSVEVYPSELLTHPVRDYEDKSLTGISWSTSSLAMGVHSAARTQAGGRDGKPHQFVQFSFEGERFSIDHFAPAGYRLLWKFAVEHHDKEDDR